MPLRNPRKFSFSCGFTVAGLFILAMLLALTFDLGDGDFLKGLRSTGSYLLLYGLGVLIFAFIPLLIAFVLGRIIGTTITTALAACLLLTFVVNSARESQPLSRFRKLIWQDAPASLPVTLSEAGQSFSDGTTYRFILTLDPPAMQELIRAASLSQTPRDSGLSLRVYFEDVTFPPDTQFYQGYEIDAHHHAVLRQQGGHIQMTFDGRTIIIDHTDDGQRAGPILRGGKLGLRQMQWTSPASAPKASSASPLFMGKGNQRQSIS